jgi:Co/Zn/Cd efflux system component
VNQLKLLKCKFPAEFHMPASMIFTSNDIIINFGVIVSAVLVSVLNSNKPDLIVGAIVFVLVIYGAIRILRLTRN